MERITVLHIITKLELGGAQKVALHTVANLDRERFHAMLFAGPDGPLDDEARALDDVKFHTVPHLRRSISPANEIRAYRELRRMIRETKPDIVHTHSSKAGVLGRLAAAAEKVPVVMHTIHGFGIDFSSNALIRRILLAAERKAAKHTTHFVAVSQRNIDDGKAMGLFDDDRASVIYAGVDLERFRSAAHKPELLDEFGFERDAPVVGMVACFKPQKNPLAFIDLAKIVHNAAPETRFLLIGDGELRNDIETRVDELGLKGVVALAGWREDVPELTRLMRVSVLTSLWEGLPCVIAESYAAGVPVVVTRAGGSAEAVEQGQTGWVVEQGEIEKQADYVLQLVQNKNLSAEMGARGPEAAKPWDHDEMVRAKEHLYLQLLGHA